jgi:Na+/H+ antiporter NhaD/arsenite permease-like protein
MIIPIVVLGIVFLLIALRDIGKVKLQIWQVMLGGAVVVLVTGQISPIDAFHAINFDVIFFLFGMFIVGQATEDSGYLTHLCHKFFGKVKSVDRLVLAILLTMGLGSAALMNAGESLTFMEFAKIGVPLTAINTAVYWVFLVYL